MKNLLLLFLTITIISCDKNNDNCKTTEPCTKELRSIIVEIVNQQGNPVYYENSEYKTYRKSNNELINVPKKDVIAGKKYNTYPVFSDINIDETVCEGDVFIFEIKQNNTIVLIEEYVIGKDYCHVMLIKGRKDIQL